MHEARVSEKGGRPLRVEARAHGGVEVVLKPLEADRILPVHSSSRYEPDDGSPKDQQSAEDHTIGESVWVCVRLGNDGSKRA
ncbi:hypothetical protein NUW54_g12349 [Trametes sanguinea]|uniref:Uncharacterized protein n=1 Tax=Trametes sanguinea TaxID=158606 RepID=A0ACC1N0R6_9APHY|nr:hypothetical protein NUW54_g12349 [Trametes sanguinea]